MAFKLIRTAYNVVIYLEHPKLHKEPPKPSENTPSLRYRYITRPPTASAAGRHLFHAQGLRRRRHHDGVPVAVRRVGLEKHPEELVEETI